MCLDLVLKHWQSLLVQIFILQNCPHNCPVQKVVLYLPSFHNHLYFCYFKLLFCEYMGGGGGGGRLREGGVVCVLVCAACVSVKQSHLKWLYTDMLKCYQFCSAYDWRPKCKRYHKLFNGGLIPSSCSMLHMNAYTPLGKDCQCSNVLVLQHLTLFSENKQK